MVLQAPPAPLTPVLNAGFLYISGCNIGVASTTVLAIAPGQARDSTNTIDMAVGSPIFINSAVNGANGLDVGTIAASTQYAVYLIASSTNVSTSPIDLGAGYIGNIPFPQAQAAPVNPYPVAGLLSLTSNAAPILPFGYDSVRLIGFIETDPSSHFVYATHEPQLMVDALEYDLQPPVSVLSGGNATTFTAVDCNAAVPSAGLPNVILKLLVTFVPASANDVVQFRPTGSSATANLPTITGLVANVAQTQALQIIAGINGTPHCSFDYKVSSGSDSVSVSVVGWIGAPHVAYPT